MNMWFQTYLLHNELEFILKENSPRPIGIYEHFLWRPKGGNLDCTSRVICACCNQILRFFNFGGHFYYSNFSSWSNESALRFFDFTLFNGFVQVFSLFKTILNSRFLKKIGYATKLKFYPMSYFGFIAQLFWPICAMQL